MPDLQMSRIDFHLHRGPRAHRRRIGVGPDPDAAAAINDGKADLGQIEPFLRQGQQMIALLGHGLPDPLGASIDQPPFILPASHQQQIVQHFEAGRLGNRNPVVAPEVAVLPLHAPFLVTGTGGAEVRLEVPVRAQGDETLGFLAQPPAQHPALVRLS
jgi:hypothetical protein